MEGGNKRMEKGRIISNSALLLGIIIVLIGGRKKLSYLQSWTGYRGVA